MYTIEKTGQKIKSFSGAVEIADKINCNVLLGDAIKWEPAPRVSAKQQQWYKERLAAHTAYKQTLPPKERSHER